MIGLVTLGALCAIFVTLWLRADQRASDLERSLGERNRRIDSELVRVMRSEANLESERRRGQSVRLALAKSLGLDQFDDQTDLLALTKAAFESSVEAVTKLVKENKAMHDKIIADACTPAPKDRASVTMPKNLAEGLAMGAYEVRPVAASPITSGVEAMGQAQRAHRAAGGRVEQPVHYTPGDMVKRDDLARAKIEPGQLRHCDLVVRRPSSVLELRRRVRDGEDLSGITHSHGCCEVEDWPLTLNRITSAELKGRV